MAGYTKLFNSILASTVWNESLETRVVWITLLAMAGKDGVAEGSIPGIAVLARVSQAAARRAIVKLGQPDPNSRSQEFDGRRIEKVDGGWLLLNHAKYRAKLNADERREYFKLKKRQQRSKSTNVQDVQDISDVSRVSTHTEADPTPEKIKSVPRASRSALTDDPAFDAFWARYPNRTGKQAAKKAWAKLQPLGMRMAIR